MRHGLVVLVFLVLTAVVTVGTAQENPPGASVLPSDPASRCVAEWARGDAAAALGDCRAAAAAGTSDPALLEILGKAELEAGDPVRAEDVFRRLIARRGWSWPLALGLARSLWRQEKAPEAEKVLRDAVRRDPAPGPARELAAFLLSYSRWGDAARVARAALERFPGDCSLHEDLGVAEAGLGHDRVAAGEIRRALEGGCPPLRWTRRGEIPHRIERAEYRALLDPGQLARNLPALREGEALHRLRLLALVLDPSVAPELARAVLDAPSAPVKLAAMHLLLRLGDAAAPQWKKVLGSKDVMLRKHALRMLARGASPGLLPVLEAHLAAETAPHNRNLTRVAVARLLLERGELERAGKLLREIPKDDPSRPFADDLLAKNAGKQ